MAGTALSFNGNSLQTGSIVTANIGHHDGPEINTPIYNIAHSNAVAMPYTDYPKKVIPVDGELIATSLAGVDALEDTLKQIVYGAKNAILDVGYNGGTRRYIGNCTKCAINRPNELFKSGFALEFTCQPFGMDTGSTSLLSLTNQSSHTNNQTPTFGGTAPYQYPIHTITFGNVVTSTTNLVGNPGFETDLTGWSSGGVGTATRTTGQHNSGSAAMQMVNAGTAVGGNYGWELYNVSGLTIGQSYTLSAYLKGNAGGEIVKMSTPGSAVISTTLTTSWQQVILAFTATATTMELDFISTSAASSTWFLDDVSVAANNTATVSVGNNATGQVINVTRQFAPGDVLVIDTTQLLNTNGTTFPVTVNGNPVAFSGALAEWPPGAASVGYNDTFTTVNYSWSLTNQNRYL